MVIREELSKQNQVAYCSHYKEIIVEAIRARIHPADMAPNVEYMASWGFKCADLSTCDKVN
jgi:hypothetical protein